MGDAPVPTTVVYVEGSVNGYYTAGLHAFDDRMRCSGCKVTFDEHQQRGEQCPTPVRKGRGRRVVLPQRVRPQHPLSPATKPAAPGIGARIRELRLELGWTQSTLEHRLESGTCVSVFERGKKAISPRMRRRLADTLGVELAWLEAGERE